MYVFFQNNFFTKKYGHDFMFYSEELEKKLIFREENEFVGEIYQKMDACFHCDPPPHQKSS